METLTQDLRYALRGLLRAPGFTLAAVATLALGIGANAAIFSVVNFAFLRPPAHVEAPERLVSVYTGDPRGFVWGVSSVPDFRDLASRAPAFQALAAYSSRMVGMATRPGAEPRTVQAEPASGAYFPVLGVRPAAGRFFGADEDAGAGQPVAVVSHGLAAREYGAPAAALGRVVRVNGTDLTVVGVAPQGFDGTQFGFRTDVWLPLSTYVTMSSEGDVRADARGSHWLQMVGRLRDGATLQDARTQASTVAGQLAAAHPGEWAGEDGAARLTFTAIPMEDARIAPAASGPARIVATVLMAVVGLVLLICCANVTNLLLARATSRRREIAVRLALGAPRRRLVRQLLTESLVLSLLGGGAGVLLAAWATSAASAMPVPGPYPVALDFRLDARVLAFALAVSLATGVLFGLAPALRATRPDLVPQLKDEVAAVAGQGRRLTLRNLLVVTQVGVCMLLLVSAGLLLRSLRNAQGADPGFDPDGVAVVSMNTAGAGLSAARSQQVLDEAAARLAALPGVEGVALARLMPLGNGEMRMGYAVEGAELGPGDAPDVGANFVGPQYFRVMSIPLRAGRAFEEADRAGAAPVAIVNERFARRWWGGRDAVGRRISVDGGATWATVVGVAATSRYVSIAETDQPHVYLPAAQNPSPDAVLAVRVTGGASAALPLLRRVAREVEPAVVPEVGTLAQSMAVSLLPRRVAAGLLSLFGGVGLLLAAVGLYGVIAFSVGQRVREIGIRMALGASGGSVLGLVVRQGMGLTAAGIAAGTVAALGLTRVLSHVLFGVTPWDPATFGGIAAILAAVALVATGLPALRATRVDPMRALRSQ